MAGQAKLAVHPVRSFIKPELKRSLQNALRCLHSLPCCAQPALLCSEAIQFSCCLQEFDFVLSDMALEVIGDFAVVWLLSPTRSFTPRAKSGLARYINALPGHALQVTLTPGCNHTSPLTLSSHICCCHNPLQHSSTTLCMTASSVTIVGDAVSCLGAITHFSTE